MCKNVAFKVSSCLKWKWLHFNRWRNATHVFFFLGGPIDLMARRVLAAGSQEIAEKASKHLECIDLPRD